MAEILKVKRTRMTTASILQKLQVAREKVSDQASLQRDPNISTHVKSLWNWTLLRLQSLGFLSQNRCVQSPSAPCAYQLQVAHWSIHFVLEHVSVLTCSGNPKFKKRAIYLFYVRNPNDNMYRRQIPHTGKIWLDSFGFFPLNAIICHQDFIHFLILDGAVMLNV